MAALLIPCSEWRIVSDGAILAQLKAQPVLQKKKFSLNGANDYRCVEK